MLGRLGNVCYWAGCAFAALSLLAGPAIMIIDASRGHMHDYDFLWSRYSFFSVGSVEEPQGTSSSAPSSHTALADTAAARARSRSAGSAEPRRRPRSRKYWSTKPFRGARKRA
jgi:hypothetical protein